VTRLPSPKGNPDGTLKAMLVDSWYDAYLGVIVLVPRHRWPPEKRATALSSFQTAPPTTSTVLACSALKWSPLTASVRARLAF
jgi:hypothetical protein